MNLCKCGCGEITKGWGQFVRGHSNRERGRTKEGLKICPICKIAKPLNEFIKCKGKRDGIGAYCKPCHIAKGRRWARANPDKMRIKWRKEREKYWRERPNELRIIKKRSDLKLKLEMIQAYGGKCFCCGESKMAFLTLEHIKRNGKEHRNKVGEGSAIWRDLKRRRWPKDEFTILCWNCNMATRFGMKCPHKMSDGT